MTVPVLSDSQFHDLLKASSLGGILDLFDQQHRAADKSPRSTIAQRKAALSEALSGDDSDEAKTQLIALQETLSNFVDSLDSSDIKLALDEEGALAVTAEQKVALMRRYQDAKSIKELAEVVNAGLKAIVGEMVTAQVAADNPKEPHPEHVSGSIIVPELGKRFCKEGAGRKTPFLDQKRLAELLGEDVWSQVVETRAVPAHEVTELSESKLMALAATDPDVLQKIAASLVPGGWKNWSFTVRDA